MSRNNAGAEMGEKGAEGLNAAEEKAFMHGWPTCRERWTKASCRTVRLALSTREIKHCYLFISVVQSIDEVGGPLRGGGAGAKLDGKEPATRRSGEEHSKLRETAKCKGPTSGEEQKESHCE